MYDIFECHSDDCTYSYDNVLFLTNDFMSINVQDKLKSMYDITDDDLVILFEEFYVEFKNIRLSITSYEVV